MLVCVYLRTITWMHEVNKDKKVKVKGQGQIFPKMVKNYTTGHISDAILPTDFILGTKVQHHNKAHQ